MTESITTIILAEDNKANQIISKAMIEAAGVSVEIAENGMEVLQLLESRPFALVLMDCQMPEMDGFEATAKIREHEDPALARIPVIALTADAQGDNRDACLAVGMDDFLTKPFNLEQVSDLLKKWLPPSD